MAKSPYHPHRPDAESLYLFCGKKANRSRGKTLHSKELKPKEKGPASGPFSVAEMFAAALTIIEDYYYHILHFDKGEW